MLLGNGTAVKKKKKKKRKKKEVPNRFISSLKIKES